MSHLDQILELFKANQIPQPSEDMLARIKAIDDGVDLKGASKLRERFLELEEACRPEWDLGQMFFPQRDFLRMLGGPFARPPQFNPGGDSFLEEAQLKDILVERKDLVLRILGEENRYPVQHGLKSPRRALVKINRAVKDGRPPKCPDLTRMRIEVPTLYELQRVYDKIYELKLQGPQLNHLMTNNQYRYPDQRIPKTYDTPFRGIMSFWSGFDPENQRDQVSTEIQLLTQRVCAITHLDHPFNVSKTVPYPEGSRLKGYIFSLMYKASILDFTELGTGRG